ncbi:MAG: transcriptional regulator, partial [Deinococcales bacterium]
YKRMVIEMRKARALENFPKRTEADLYIFMMDHRYNLSQHYGQDVGSKVAAQSFVRHNRVPWYQRVWGRLLGSKH